GRSCKAPGDFPHNALEEAPTRKMTSQALGVLQRARPRGNLRWRAYSPMKCSGQRGRWNMAQSSGGKPRQTVESVAETSGTLLCIVMGVLLVWPLALYFLK